MTIAELEARVVDNPWKAIGAALLVGAWLGLEPPHAPRSRFARSAFAMIGSVAVRMMRDVAFRELAGRMTA